VRTLGLFQRDMFGLQPDWIWRDAESCRTDEGECEFVRSAVPHRFGGWACEGGWKILKWIGCLVGWITCEEKRRGV